LVYDPAGAPAEEARRALGRWQARCPARPVLLYCSPRTVDTRLLAELASLPGVVAYLRQDPSAEAVHHLATLLRSLLAQRPGLLLSALLAGLRPNPSARLQAFVAALVQRLAHGGPHAPTVRSLATEAGLTAWQLRRECRGAHLPNPERLVEWLTLLYLLALAAGERISLARAASRASLSAKYLRQLRRRLLPGIPVLRGQPAGELLTFALDHFARSVGLAPEHRARLVAHMLPA